MGLSLTWSKKTFSHSSSTPCSQESIEGSDKILKALKDSSNVSSDSEGRGNKNRVSMMRKSNRISIAEAIKISELQDLKKLVPL